MEPETLSPLLVQPTLYPYAKHIIGFTNLHALSPTPFLNFSFSIRLGLLNSFFRISGRTLCEFSLCMAWGV